MRVLVTHPGRQHSHQAALALAKAGMLAGYWAGAPSLARHGCLVPRRLWRRFVRYAPVELPAERVLWYPWPPVLRRLADAALPPAAAARVDFAACRLFDRWAARRLARAEVDAVIACEISALETFRAAKARGLITLLDAPSIHHAAQDRLHGFAEPARLHRRITAIKDLEIDLADAVITVSELARDTYLEAGVSPERVLAIPLGADTELFSPEDSAPAREGGAGAFTFVFSGAMIRRKGFDLLAAAFDRVRAELPDVRLVIAGPPGDAAGALDAYDAHGIERRGSLPQAELARLLRAADCLVLPSRNDSYGMVVAEALASGLPVIASRMVGAKDLMVEGESGWVVPVEDVGALAERMAWCARHRAEVRAMRPACRRAAEAATWPAYHQRFVQAIAAQIARSPPP